MSSGDTIGYVPQEIEDAVILWGRAYNRQARIGYHKLLKCYAIQLDSPPDDPKWAAFRDGKLKQRPTEFVPLNRQDPSTKSFVGIPLDELSATGITEMLDEANLWSGRGEYDDIASASAAVLERNEKNRLHYLEQVEEGARESAWLHRRSIFNLPQSAVGIDLKSTSAPEEGPKPGNVTNV